jgi:serine/threonine protein kinase
MNESAGADDTDANRLSGTEPAHDATRMLASGAAGQKAEDDGRTVVLPRSPAPAPNTALVATRLAPQNSSVEPSLLATGSRLGEFEITGVVGQGGFGVVYKGWDHALEREVAIKEYFPASLAARQNDGSVVPLSEGVKDTFEAGMRSFFNEARLLAQFDHPSLLKVYRFWQERGTTYMVMPLYKGDTLKTALAARGSEVDEQWLLSIMDGVTQALAVMHRVNCYHRDIAPDNILLLEGSGRPVVLDFGAARRVITDMAQAITVILKPGYAPIEQYAEVPDMTQGAWTDVYALGAVMHVAVCGRPPPPSVARLLNDRYVPLSTNQVLSASYSQRLLKSIDASLSVRPEGRPQSIAALRESLGLDLDGSAAPAIRTVAATKAPAPITSEKVSGAKGRKRRLGAAVILVVAVMAGGGAWWTMQSRQIAPVVDGNAAAPANASRSNPPGPAEAARFDPARVLTELATAPAGAFEVVATAAKQKVQINKDRLEFRVRSSQAGYVYVYMLSSGGELYQLFPNQLDKRNQIKAGETLSLPRPSWPMESGGPPGSDQFTVVVSERERDLSGTGIQYDGVFGQFPPKVLAALESARAGRGPSALLGKAICPPADACSESYGATGFTIVEE